MDKQTRDSLISIMDELSSHIIPTGIHEDSKPLIEKLNSLLDYIVGVPIRVLINDSNTMAYPIAKSLDRDWLKELGYALVEQEIKPHTKELETWVNTLEEYYKIFSNIRVTYSVNQGRIIGVDKILKEKELYSYINLNINQLFNLIASPRERVAILLHELGHIYNSFTRLTAIYRTNNRLVDSLYDRTKKEVLEIKDTYLITGLVKAISTYEDELSADRYVMKQGFGKELSDILSTQVNVDYETPIGIDFSASLILYELYNIKDDDKHSDTIRKVLLGSYVDLLSTSHHLDVNPHTSPLDRVEAIYLNMIKDYRLNNTELDLVTIEKIKSFLEKNVTKYTDVVNVLERYNAKDGVSGLIHRLYMDIDNLSENQLYILLAKMKKGIL